MRDHGRIDLASTAPFRIGLLCVEPALRQVSTTETDAETLEPRVMLVLVALARAEGAIVSRDQLIAQCWDSRVVGDDSINRVISRLRKLAAAHGDDALFSIETISKVGYRLVSSSCERAKSEAASSDLGNAAKTASPFDHRSAKRRRWLWAVPPIAAIGAAIGFVSLPAASPDQPVIALDRFAVNGTLPAGYADALRVDMLASNQSNRGSVVFGIPARIVTSTGRGADGSFNLAGGVTGEGASARIHAELTESGSTTPIWAARYIVPATAEQRSGVADRIIATTLCVIYATRQRPVSLAGAALTP